MVTKSQTQASPTRKNVMATERASIINGRRGINSQRDKVRLDVCFKAQLIVFSWYHFLHDIVGTWDFLSAPVWRPWPRGD